MVHVLFTLIHPNKTRRQAGAPRGPTKRMHRPCHVGPVMTWPNASRDRGIRGPGGAKPRHGRHGHHGTRAKNPIDENKK